MARDSSPAVDRRTVLGTLGSLAGASALAGCSFLQRGSDDPTEKLSDERARDLAERFAPTLYFDEDERWFPTDPRPYTSDRDGETVVDGFDALEGYVSRQGSDGDPPDPTLFYNARKYEDSSLGVVQFWMYSVFDQFTTNFHWHDWEVLHAFVDLETEEPQLYVASSHSGRVPNNEFVDPEAGDRPRVLSELGSHSSALSLNDVADRFQRLQVSDSIADITNGVLEGVETLSEFPLAYGLPRDEGSRLPYVVPEHDGAPVYEHDRLPSVDRSDLLPPDLTVRSFADLQSPPTDLPERTTGLVFDAAGREGDADVAYDLVPASDVEHIASFTGPQLSFEFGIPKFAEDAIASHITAAGTPWEQPRYEAPTEDISDPDHRAALAERYDVIGERSPANALVASISQAVSDPEAPDGEGVTTDSLGVETVALLESDPEAVPSFGGHVVLQDVPAGEHRLTVNGAGVRPHSEAVAVAEPTTAGVEGAVPLVAREDATKLAVDPEGSDADLTDLAVEDDFGGRLYDAPLDGPDAVYVHRGGAYTAEVRDAADDLGAHRVNPGEESRVAVENPQTGTGSLAGYVADVAAETSDAVAAVQDGGDGGGDGGGEGGAENAVTGLARALDAVAEAARRAADRAAAGDRGGADRSLQTVQDRLGRVATRLQAASEDLPDDLERAVGHRLDQSRRRSKQARNANSL